MALITSPVSHSSNSLGVATLTETICTSGLIALPVPFTAPSSSRNRRRVVGLFDAQAADRPADHELLDLLGAFEDVVDLRVAVHALDGVLTRVPVAAVDLDGALGDPHGDASGLELRLRALGIGVAAVAGEPRGAPDEQPRRVDLGDHVGEHERDRLVLDDRLAEGDGFLALGRRPFVGGAAEPGGRAGGV